MFVLQLAVRVQNVGKKAIFKSQKRKKNVQLQQWLLVGCSLHTDQ